MCRISGIINPAQLNISLDDFIDVHRSMRHGGPDDEGTYADEYAWLGHNRLSIIDLSICSHQPMQVEHVVLTYNGEIYNYHELKDELIQKGHKFSSSGDTEVIAKAYIEWGENCFSRFNGMFAFGLLDKKEKKFFLVRDPSGIKPLYYIIKNNALVFASEVRAFYQLELFEESDKWRTLLLAFGHIPAPFTTLKDVKIFPKGNFLRWNVSNSTFTIQSFYRYSFDQQNITLSESVELIRNKLISAVKRHLISDAPVGVFLSGGIDSSLLALIAAREKKEQLKTISVYFDEKEYSEHYYQKLISDRLPGEHLSVKITVEDLFNSYADIFHAMDQPTTDGINSYFISSVAHKKGLKTVLSGIGADELFGGYPSFRRMKWMNVLQYIPGAFLSMMPVTGNDKIKRFDYLKQKNSNGDYLFLRGLHTVEDIVLITGNKKIDVQTTIDDVKQAEEIKANKSGNKVSWLESNYYMNNQLLKDADMMSMWHSLEIRVPFLDKELIETIYSIPPEIKFNSTPKHLLIKAFKDVLPEEIYNRPKKGFTFPLQHWLLNKEILSELENINPVNRKFIEQFKMKNMHWSRIWALYIINFWKEKRYALEN